MTREIQSIPTSQNIDKLGPITLEIQGKDLLVEVEMIQDLRPKKSKANTYH